MTCKLSGVHYITIIVTRKYKDPIIRFLIKSDCHLIKVVYANGTLQTGYLKDMLGLMPEEKKVMISCLIKGNLSEELLDDLMVKFDFDKPNTGIAFSVPVSRICL